MTSSNNQKQHESPTYSDMIKTYRRLAKKYKEMSLPVQRLNAVKDALFWRKIEKN